MLNEKLLKDYAADCTRRTMKTDFAELGKVIDILIKAKRDDKVIYTAGNGGSLATASHICNDLAKGCRVHNRTGFNAICLGDSTAVITCLSNDFCYEDFYKIQIETKIKSGDVFLVFLHLPMIFIYSYTLQQQSLLQQVRCWHFLRFRTVLSNKV